MTGNYKNVGNVRYAKFLNDGEDGDPDPDIEGFARVDELYVERYDGKTYLYIGLEAPDGFESIKIPILRGESWEDVAKDIVGTLR